MADYSLEISLVLVVLSVLLRMNGALLIWNNRRNVAVRPALVLDLFSPILCIIYVSFVSGRSFEERSRAWGTVWGTAVIAIAFFLSQIFAGLVFSGLLHVLGAPMPHGRAVGPWARPGNFDPLYILLVVSYSGLLALSVLRMVWPKLSPSKWFRGKELLSSSLISLGALPLVLVVSLPLMYLIREAGIPGSTELFGEPSGALDISYLVLALVVVAPLVEELLFRGYMYEFIDRKAGREPAIIITAWLFALFHFDFLSFIPIFAMGLVMGYVRSRSGSLVPSLLMHSVNNLVAVVVLLI